MLDRPAGAVEGTQDAVALETSALEALMATVMFRPTPTPQQTDVTSAASEGATPQQADITPAASGVSDRRQDVVGPATPSELALAPAVLANLAATQAASRDEASPIDLSGVSLDVGSDAMRAAAQAAQRLILPRGKATNVTRDGTSDAATIAESTMEGMTLTGEPSSEVSASGIGTSKELETKTPLNLLAGMDDVQLIEVTTSGKPGVRVSVHEEDGLKSTSGEASGPAVLDPNSSRLTDAGNAAPVAAAKAGGVQSLPVAAQVAETVRSAVLRGDHEIRLLLNPGDLGQIDIRIMEQHGVLQLRLDASHSSTRDLLAREMPALQQALEARDLRVERIQVSHSGSASAGGSGAAWQQGTGRQGQERERDGSPAWSPVASLTQSGRGQQEMRRTPRMIRHHGVLDRMA